MPTQTRAVTLSHPDKVLFPDDGITKRDLARHYRAVAGRMLPALRDRPLAVARYPEGIGRGSFFQQAAPAHAPSWIGRATVAKEGGEITHLLCQDTDTLDYLSNQNAVTLHSWLARADRPQRPDQAMFDLDPPGNDFGQARQAALALRALLEEVGLASLVKTSGSRGLHVSDPIARRHAPEQVHAFAHAVCEVLGAREPERYTNEFRKAKRGGRLYLDVSRNVYAQLVVAPYTVRARRGAPVATPLDWSEVEDRALRPDRFTVRTMPGRLADADPWQNPPKPAASLGPALSRVAQLLAEAR
jgi:bifunctional non-homologous end joining protein LigD